MTAWLVDTLLATSALALFVLLVREPVRRWFGSRVAYALWLIPAARMFMPTLRHTVERTMPATHTLQPFTDPFVRESLWMARVAPPDPSLLHRVGGWPAIFIAAWLTVAAGLFLSRMAAFHRDRRAIIESSVEVGRSGRVRIVRSPEVLSPFALGILDPVIAVPFDFERLYGERERRLVLEHELAHHRSGDLAANLFAFVLLCLQWFNPLAWVAHAAFRFDQEAACDARVLDKISAGDRADYGRAIAKAASGRALLFASALDRPNTLKRRLQSMLHSSNPSVRLAGRLLVVSAIAAALPLTASRAVDYVDVLPPAAGAAPASIAGSAIAATSPSPASAIYTAIPARAIAMTTAGTPAAAQSARAHSFDVTTGDGQRFTIAAASTYTVAAPDGQHFILNSGPAGAQAPSQFNITGNGETFTIDGKTKRWEDLTPAEKAQVRAAVERARTALANAHIDRERIARSIASIPSAAQMEKMQRDLAGSKARIAETVRQLDAHRDELRKAGMDSAQIEATVAEAMKSVQAVDMQAVAREVASIDRGKVADDLAHAETSMRAARAELDRVQARMDADQPR